MNIQDFASRWGGQSPAQIAARASEHLPFWVSLVLVVIIGYQLARLFWALWPGGTGATWVVPPLPAPDTATVNAPAVGDFRSIVSAHLFGQVSADTPADGNAALHAPDTSLSLQLRGAVAADDPAMAHAIIADSGGSEKVYFVDGTVPGGAKVQAIQRDRVVLSRNGQLEVLRLPREAQKTGGGSPAAVPVARSPGPPTAADEVAQQFVEQNAASFLDVVRPQPFMPNGQLKGYRVYPGPNRQQFTALGLRPGDLVTEINGVALNNPAQGMEVFRSLGDASQVAVTVERDGQPQVLSFNMSQINAMGGATQ